MTAVVLFGNGLSQGFSGELSLGRTTQRVRDRIEEGNHVDTQLLDEVATLAAPEGWGGVDEPAQNFEALAGPIDRIAQAMGLFDLLADAQTDRLAPFRQVANELRRLYVSIVGLILDEIDRFCVEDLEANQEWGPINDMAKALGDLTDDVDELCIYTLNYDSLLPSALANSGIDYYDGFRGLSLNSPLEPWNAELTFYHLHGSLSWIDRGGLPTSRVTYEASRNQWLPSWVDGNLDQGLPAVVLSDLKSRVVQRYPFSVFYEAFGEDLARANSVAVAGYGFGDRPVNQQLAKYLGDHPQNSITVLHPHAGTRAAGWIGELRTLTQGLHQNQLVPVDCCLPDADAIAGLWN